jgi:hypothetical protein
MYIQWNVYVYLIYRCLLRLKTDRCRAVPKNNYATMVVRKMLWIVLQGPLVAKCLGGTAKSLVLWNRAWDHNFGPELDMGSGRWGCEVVDECGCLCGCGCKCEWNSAGSLDPSSRPSLGSSSGSELTSQTQIPAEVPSPGRESLWLRRDLWLTLLSSGKQKKNVDSPQKSWFVYNSHRSIHWFEPFRDMTNWIYLNDPKKLFESKTKLLFPNVR